MSKILVTGGTGYIGSHTVVELYKAGYTPVIIDNLSNSSSKILAQIEKIIGVKPEFHQFDLCDTEQTTAFINNNPDISGIIHFAASKAVGESVQKPLKYYHNNFFSLINLLEAYQEKKINFVFSSSCTVYGEPDALPVTESAPVKRASSPYGNTKQIAEEILAESAAAYDNYNIIALRYFNPVGAHESALIGELPLGVPQNLLPFITQTAIGKREKLTVFGNDFDTPDGYCIRDFIHVVDLAKAHVAAIQLLEKGNPNGKYDVFNVGTGKGYSVLEAIKAFEKVSGKTLNYEVGPRREGDIVKVYGDVTKSSSELGWKAQLGIEEMMSSAWKWENYLKENPIE
ncbi:UDP-glucose 4-epimerase GalE [Sphingobacterium alkalisoli]|uniref:UDP-glucose 4-epimerase n=2 Tax=Sphingobacterium TaxID=28453 RepID=A0A4U0NZX0_9SPHI|nr:MULTISPECIES: UDP-glucose 4-epimerase GalE [Sphingobacterium]TJY68188.1 UDP-glucose 4-epimerase GalE [Sphingobacterium alkalisoli]TJZ60415.1 UDP-glucose 4-epimerase GalE [Sphingobacterium olei]GGH08424.1 UDP-glucose 4-epimerase [Sphingobacterium alkalisoli]